MDALRKLALKLPEATEGIACKGTPIECPTIQVRNKAFLFLGASAIKLKLSDSLSEAANFEAKDSERFKVGAHGWVDVKYSKALPLPIDILGRWVEESYRLFAPKQLLSQLPMPETSAHTSPKPKPKGSVKAASRKKSAR